MELDDWQKKVLDTKGNICLRSGRQVGKSTIVAQKAGEFATHNKKTSTLIIASTERQAQLLFDKTLTYLLENYKTYIERGKDKPTRHKIQLNNGSVIHCLPTGLTGYGIRGYTINLLIADEAAFIPDEVWTAVTPMLATTKGDIILLSTPFGKDGYFYRCFNDESFSSFHISSEECSRIDRAFLKKEKERMSKLEYAQEYLGEFVDELRQFFPTKLIRDCMLLNEDSKIPEGINYLGVDVARMGEDQSVLFTLTKVSNMLYMKEMLITEKTFLTDTIRDIKEENIRFNYRKIYIDDGGMGVGVFDPLLEDEETKRKVIAINNSSRSLDKKEEQRKKLLKEDLYNNLLVQMEQSKIVFYKDEELMKSLKSVQAEYTDRGLRIFGRYTHITEALIRAAWCVKDKSLNIWIR